MMTWVCCLQIHIAYTTVSVWQVDSFSSLPTNVEKKLLEFLILILKIDMGPSTVTVDNLRIN